MDAHLMSKKVIIEGITKGNYELTGILETGEIVIAITGKIENEILVQELKSSKSKDEKLKIVNKIKNIKGRPANEIIQIYNQYTCDKKQRCLKNGLRLRNI